MVKNIVFDMGKVLTDYVPDAVCRHYIKDEAMIRKISDAVFVSPEWVLLDLGVVPEDEGLRRITERLDTPQEKEWAAQCFWHWHEYNMWHMEGMEELVRSLKAAGYGIFAGTLPQGQAHIKSRVCPRRNFLNKKENPRYIAWTTFRRGLLPLADDVVAVAVDHVVYINAGEPICHVRYHFLSSFVRL